MSSTSPSPNSPLGTEAPISPNSTQAQPSSPPLNPRNSPPSTPPSAPPTVSPPPRSRPPSSATPSMASPPPTRSPPPEPTVSPPPPANVSAPSLSPPPQPSGPTPTSPPPPVDPPANSPPPPPPSDPPNSPPPPSNNQSPPSAPISPGSPPPAPPQSSNTSAPPPPTIRPPGNSSPPTQPPKSSPTPPSPQPPGSSPPPPLPTTPGNSAPPPPNSGTTPAPSHSPPPSPPISNTPPNSSLPPAKQVSPPPPSFFSPPSPPSASIVPPGTENIPNSSNDNTAQNSQSTSGGGLDTVGIVAIVLVLGLLFLGILVTAVCCLKKRKKASGHYGRHIMPTSLGSSQEADSALLKLQNSSPKNGSGSGIGIVHSPHEPGGFGNSRSWFTYEELVQATNGFSAQNLLGEGGFGSVYKGSLPDGRDVAVKQLKIGGGQGEREFRSEVEIISRIHHRHLVSLVGYCINENRRLLVYDYVPNNNLYFHLHGEGRPVLDWATRVKIALGAARGIAYLHEDCHPRIIHRDIKSSNILLDNNFEARVSDFGLAKLAVDANSHITTRVMGTFGYMAPEYASSGKLTERSDVYSFGVVLLELITGRKPVDASQPLGEESLVEWARPLLSQALETQEFVGLADPRLERQYVDGEMFQMIEAAAACVRHSSGKRPKMGQVVRALDTLATTDLTNGMRVGESEMFNSAQQSAEIRLFRRMAFGSQNHSTGFFLQDSWGSEGNQVNSRTE